MPKLLKSPNLKDFLWGALTALAMPPFYIFPLALGGMAWLFYRLYHNSNEWHGNASEGGNPRDNKSQHGAVIAFWFGFGLFLGGCWWITNALFFEKQKFLWLLLPALVAVPACLALFTAAAGGLFSLVGKRLPITLALWVFASLWAFSEWARGALFPHFNWNPLASIWSFSPHTMQLAALTGQTGLSLLTAALGASLVVARPVRLRGGATLVALVAVVVLGGGSLRLHLTPTELSQTKLYLVQPAIAQDKRWEHPFTNFQLRYQMTARAIRGDPKGRLRGEAESTTPKEKLKGEPKDKLRSETRNKLGGEPEPTRANSRGNTREDPRDKLRSETRNKLGGETEPARGNPRGDTREEPRDKLRSETRNKLGSEPARSVILWGETASPYDLKPQSQATKTIASILPKNSVAMVGHIHKDKTANYYNSLAVINPDATIATYYHKTRLVPFGEYLPLRWLMGLIGLRQTIGGKDFTMGKTHKVIEVAGVPPFIPLICFESIFPLPRKGVFAPEVAKASWILNATNDGWFGKTPGPYQHFAAARMRAVESGLPLIRVADGGISALIDSSGRVLKRLPLGNQGVLSGYLPLAKPTIYNHFGAFITWFWILLWTLIPSLWLIITRKKVGNESRPQKSI